MKLRKWTPEEKIAIVLEGLKGQKSVAEICRENQISQTLFYRRRDRFLEAAKRVFGVPEFRFCALADGIKEHLFARKWGFSP